MQENDRTPRTTVIAVCLSEKKGTVKKPVEGAVLLEDYGIAGDAHGGTGRQVSFLCADSVRKMEGRGVDLPPGVFAENFRLDGLRIEEVRPGQVFRVSSGPVLEVTKIGKTCHKGCEIRRITGDCIMPREGFFAMVVKGGTVRPGDEIRIE